MLTGVGEQVDENLLNTSRIGAEGERGLVFRSVIHTHAGLQTMLRTGDGSFAHEVLFAIFIVYPVAAVIHCRRVQNIVQKHREHFGVVHDVPCIFLLLFRSEGAVGKRQQLREAHYCV